MSPSPALAWSNSWLRTGRITVADLTAAFEEIVPRLETEALLRVDEEDFRRKFNAFMALAAGEEPEPG